jgi:hypothetical protein
MTMPDPSGPKVLRVYAESDGTSVMLSVPITREGEDLSELLVTMLTQVIQNQSTILEKVDRLEQTLETLRKET